jgi:PAS domain S-box-containing protein
MRLKVIDESRRVEVLRTYRILDTGPEPAFDDVVERASALFNTPIALVGFVDERRLWLKASRGVTFREAPRELSICDHIVRDPRPLFVLDLARDARFAGNPLVVLNPTIHFYAGMPIVSPDGHCVGAVCVMDTAARSAVDRAAVAGLAALARLCRNELEHRLAIREFAGLFHHHPEPMWIHEPGTLRFLEVNDAMCAIYGYTREELAAMTVDDLRVPEGPRALTHLVATLPAGVSYEVERQHVTKNGSLIDVVVRAVTTEFGGCPARLVIVRDVTQQRAAEALAANAERTRRRNQQIDALGTLASGIAHDLNNKLAVIIGNAEALLDQAAPGSEARTTLETMIRTAEGSAELINQLLAFARRQPLRPRRVDINGFIARMEEELRRSLGDRVEIALVPSSDLAAAIVDPAQLEAAIHYLSLNARDAMPEGGRLTISIANTRVDAACAVADPEVAIGDYVVIAVSDTGTGMLPETAARAFEPFFTTKDVGKGTGLGLSMVHGFVHQSGGFVTIESAIGRGTTIMMHLPAAPPA